MMKTSPPDGSTGPRRSWVVPLYFYLAALIGLGLLIGGTTTALFGLKNVLVPELSVSSYAYDPGPGGDARRADARRAAVDDRRREGADQLVNGAILAGVGLPTLLWHLRRARGQSSPESSSSSQG